MKKFISIVLTAVCAAALFAGCSTKAPEAAAEAGNVSLDGSTSMEKVMQVLIEAFQEQQPNVTVNYTGSGSGAGVFRLGSGVCARFCSWVCAPCP